MKKPKAKGKRQKANLAAPAALPPPESHSLDDASPSAGDSLSDAAASESVDPPAAQKTVAPQKSATSYDRATQLLAERGTLLLTTIAAVLSIACFVYCFANDMTNHYGDGLAHVNIARKVVDSPDRSLWQRYLQIGTPWLPLQTVLMLPLVANDGLWRSGAAGSLVSMIAFVIAAIMIFQIARQLYRQEDGRLAVWMPVVALAIFALNPSVLLMQTTPMTEMFLTRIRLAGTT